MATQVSAKMAASMAKQGITPSGTSPAPAPVGGGVNAQGQLLNSSGTAIGPANPKDLPGYSAVGAPNAKINPTPTDTSLQPTPQVSTAQPSPATVNPTPFTGNAQTQTLPNVSNTPVSAVAAPAPVQGADQLKQKYNQALSTLGPTQAPQSKGEGSAGVAKTIAQQPQSQSTPEAVSNFLTPENPAVQQSTKQLMDWLNPESDRKMLNDHIAQLAADRSELSGLKTELMNTKRVMAGSEQDIRDEVTKAGGFATDSQVQALTIARNRSLVQKAGLISDQIQSQTDIVNSDVSLVGDEKQMAAQQFTQRMSLLNYQQENQKNMLSAAKDQFKTIVDAIGYDGAYAAYQKDPAQLARIEQISGLGANGLQKAAETAGVARANALTKDNLQLDVLRSNLQTDKLQRSNIQSQIDERNGTTVGGDPSELTGYAQEYASSGKIPTGIPKGSFGKISQIAKEIPKSNGELVDKKTGVSPQKLNGDVTQGGVVALYDITKKMDQLKNLYNSEGPTNATTYNTLKGEIVDAISRARSGAALTPQEAATYESKIPGFRLSLRYFGNTQLDTLNQSIQGKLGTILDANGAAINGFSKVDVGGTQRTVGEVIDIGGTKYRVLSDGTVSDKI